MTERQLLDVASMEVTDIGECRTAVDVRLTFHARKVIDTTFLTEDEYEAVVGLTKCGVVHDMFVTLRDEFRDQEEIDRAYHNGYMAGRRGYVRL